MGLPDCKCCAPQRRRAAARQVDSTPVLDQSMLTARAAGLACKIRRRKSSYRGSAVPGTESRGFINQGWEPGRQASHDWALALRMVPRWDEAGEKEQMLAGGSLSRASLGWSAGGSARGQAGSCLPAAPVLGASCWSHCKQAYVSVRSTCKRCMRAALHCDSKAQHTLMSRPCPWRVGTVPMKHQRWRLR